MVYGPGDRQRRFRWAVEHMTRSVEPLRIPRAWAEWVATHGHVKNVAAGIALSAGNERAFNCIFNIGESTPVDKLEWARRIARLLGWTGMIEVSADIEGEFARSLEPLDLTVPFRIDSSKIRKALGYSERVGLVEGLEETVADERSRS